MFPIKEFSQSTKGELTMTFAQFLEPLVASIKKKSLQVNQASWLLETTGSPDAASLRAELDTELRRIYSDNQVFDKLLTWEKKQESEDPHLKRQLNVLIRTYKPNQVNPSMLEKIAIAESELLLLYSNFRAEVDGKRLSENEIKEILKAENDVKVRKKVWDASKQIGKVMAPKILNLVKLRNETAKAIGYSDYFTMQLALQEVDEKWLFETFDKLSEDSEAAYAKVVEDINTTSSKRFQVPKEEIGPWAWSEPFCQEDPIDAKELDDLVQNIDILKVSQAFYQKMGFDVEQILKRSDNFERQGKNQHAFCIHMDREGDIRTLNNINSTIKWLETVLHELGHAVYEEGYPKDLPWLLKEPPHMATTEAMALLMGRQAYRTPTLNLLVGPGKEALKAKAEHSLKRRQLIFSRWVLVMTYFERELYRNPDQDLNKLWWQLVNKHQKIQSEGSSYGCDWAAKFHISLAPAYYFSYLLGELFASSLEEAIPQLASASTKQYLNDKLFSTGNLLKWSDLIQNILGGPLSAKAWLKQFAS